MGIEHATARVQELQALTQSIRGTTTPAQTLPADQAAAFSAQLQSQLLFGSGGAAADGAAQDAAFGGVPVINAQQLMQLQGGAAGGSSGLGIQAMLAGMMPAAGAAPMAGPSQLTGDLDGLDPQLRAGLEQVAATIGSKIDVISGNRTFEEQSALYQKYLNGTGNLAARPGTSNHEHGAAADVYVNGVALANVPGAREAAAAAGLGFPVAGEAWHVERV